MSRLAYTASLLMAVAVTWLLTWLGPAQAQQFAPAGVPRAPFTATLSNNVPLAFGMEVEDVSRALREPLSYISGPPGDEIYLAFRNIGGSGLFITTTGCICNSARADWQAGKAIGATTG